MTLKLAKVYMVPCCDKLKHIKKSQGKDFFEFVWDLYKSAQCSGHLHYSCEPLLLYPIRMHAVGSKRK